MEISEKTQILSGLIKTYCLPEYQPVWFPSEAEIANQDWAASHFIFQFLILAKPAPRPTVAAFEKFQIDFQEKTGTFIDHKNLIARHWVRVWNGEIRIANQISQQLVYFYDWARDRTKPDFWEKYELDLRFLYEFSNVFLNEDVLPVLSRSQFLDLYEKHKAAFPKMPCFDELLKSDWFLEDAKGDIALKKFQSNNHNHSVANEVATLAWRHLTENESEKGKLELLHEWESMVLKNGFYPHHFLSKTPFAGRQKFMDAALQRIENEKDLVDPDHEILKGRLDFYMSDHGGFSLDAMPDFTLKSIGAFNVYEEINRWDRILDIFHYQPARENLWFYIREILHLEKTSQLKVWEANWAKNVECLLEKCHTRPALLFTFCDLLKKDYPEMLPLFFRSTEHISLGCRLAQDLPIRPEILPENHRERYLPEQQTRSLIFQAAFETALIKLANEANAHIAGKTFCEILLPLAQWMFHEKGEDKIGFAVANEFNQRFQKAWATLNSSSNQANFRFLKSPKTLVDFAEGFVKRLENPTQLPVQNDLVHLDLPFLALLSSLFQMVGFQRKNFPGEQSLMDLEVSLRQIFVKKYCAELGTRQIEVLIWRQNATESRPATWPSEPNNIDFLEFEPLFEADRITLRKFLDAARPQDCEQVLEAPLPPGMSADDEEARWLPKREDKIRSEKIKFRTHFRVILRFYRAFVADKNRMKIGHAKWASGEEQIRQKLLDWSVFNRNDSVTGIFDLYEPLFENFYSSENPLPPLIQDVAQTVNFFPKESHRQQFVESLIDGMLQLDILLKIYNALNDISCRITVQNLIQGTDIEYFTGNQFLWEPIESALINATNEEGFTDIAEYLLEFVLNNANRKREFFGIEYAHFLLEIKLILAYRKKDRYLLNLAAEGYKAETGKTYDEYLERRLQFFDGVFLMLEEKYENALQVWINLSQSDRSVEIHYRKFYCRINLSTHEKDEGRRRLKILEAYEDWEKYESSNGKSGDFEKLREGILFCKMVWLDARNADAEFDFLQSQLAQTTLYEFDVLKLIFQNYARRGMDFEAGLLFLDAQKHYATADEKKLEVLNTLQKLFNSEPLFDHARKAFAFLNSASAEDLVKVVPDFFNPQNTIPEFLLAEFKLVADELLGKINSIKSVEGENKFNDFFTLLLRMRLSFLRFEISDQPREGEAKSDAGEADMVIRHGAQKVAAYEAFFYKDTKYIEEHLVKVFDYIPNGRLFFSVVFNMNKGFEKTFESYKTIVKETPFPERYKLNSGFEIVEGFQNLPNIFFGKTLHSDGLTTMFHLFINLAYGEKTKKSLK